MYSRPSTRGLLRVAMGCLLGAALAAGFGHHAYAEDDDDDDLSFEQRIIRGIMGGLGAQVGPGGGIDYRERSPLVIPPTRDLPPPDSVPTAQRTPAWPNDPDQRAKVKTKTAKRAPTVRDMELANDPGKALTAEELRRGTLAGAGRVTTPADSTRTDESGRGVPPSMLGYTGGIFGSLFGNTRKEETAVFTQEPPRTALTAPPSGYQTPSPNQPYGLGQQRWFPTIPNPFNRGAEPN